MNTHPWDRLPNETNRNFRAFEHFRDLGPGRTLEAAASACYGRPVSKPGGNWSAWRADHEWDARCAAWDTRTSEPAPEPKAAPDDPDTGELLRLFKRRLHAALLDSRGENPSHALYQLGGSLDKLTSAEVRLRREAREIDAARAAVEDRIVTDEDMAAIGDLMGAVESGEPTGDKELDFFARVLRDDSEDEDAA